MAAVREKAILYLRPPPGNKCDRRTNLFRKNLTNPEDANLMEILDRVLDHGIVVDPSVRVLLSFGELRKMNGRMVVESIMTWA